MVKIINKKSQVTAFIIIGLIILISAFLIFYVISMAGKKAPETEVLKEKPYLAGQTELRQYVDACIKTSVLQGLEIIRLQGGYINIPTDVPTLLVKDKENNEQVKIIDGSKKVVIDAYGEGNKVPYWINKDGIDFPSLDFIENELRQYVTEEVMKCIDDFKPFKEQKYNVSYGDINTNVEMEKAVVVNIKFPIKMKKESVEINQKDFVYTVPINMRLVYDMTSDLTVFESLYAYLEEHTKSLISLYSEIDENRLPPTSKSVSNFDCSFVSWDKLDVKEMLKGILEMNIAYLKVKNTDFERIAVADPVAQGTYDSFIYEFFEENYPSLRIDYNYRKEWEFMDYDIKPSSGNTLMPHRTVGGRMPLLPLICVFEYPFKYTVEYPVLVQVKDSKSARIDPVGNVFYENEGYKLNFPFWVYLCGNQKRRCTGGIGLTVNATEVANEMNVTLLPESYFCNPEQRISNVKINAFDSFTNGKLSYVDVYYYCGSYQNNCFIGRTNNEGVLETKFPLCINGVISLIKIDYSEFKEMLTTHGTDDLVLNYRLSPLKEFNVEVKKVYIPDFIKNYHETGSLSISGSIKQFENDENVIISANGPSFVSYYYPDPDNGKVKLGAGVYSLSMDIYGNVNILETDYGNGVVMDGFDGSYTLGTTSINWNLMQNEMLNKNKVTFYALAEHSPSDLNPGTWHDIDDSIIRADGNLSSELLYRCEKTGTLPGMCNYDNCNFVEIDGNNIDDLRGNSLNCEKAYDVVISKKEYEDYIKPKFS